jgi:hypothetical protein
VPSSACPSIEHLLAVSIIVGLIASLPLNNPYNETLSIKYSTYIDEQQNIDTDILLRSSVRKWKSLYGWFYYRNKKSSTSSE